MKKIKKSRNLSHVWNFAKGFCAKISLLQLKRTGLDTMASDSILNPKFLDFRDLRGYFISNAIIDDVVISKAVDR